MSPLPRPLATLLVVGLAFTAGGDEPSAPSKKKSPEPPELAEVRFADGSTVRMLLTQSAVEITTRYGMLEVPIADIRRIEFGFRYSDGALPRIEASAHKLSTGEPKEREAAAQELLAFSEMAYPTLKRLATGTDREVAKRAADVIRRLEDKVGAEKLKLVRDLDTLHAVEFTVAGRIEAPTLKGRTTYFGEVTVQVAELRTIRFLGGTGGEIELVVDAAKYAALSQDVWLDTEVDVAESSSLVIQASGIVDLWPQGGNYKVGPDAMPRMGTSPDGNPSGMLLGRIGERGKVFQVGSKFNGTPAESGRLYLRIACSPWNNASTGSFAVKIDANADSSGPPPAPAPTKPKSKSKLAKEK
jgi:hypothetical protein